MVEAAPLDAERLFNALFAALATLCLCLKLATRQRAPDEAASGAPPEGKMTSDMHALKLRFLAVFWCFKMADWLQGPYFYNVYMSKVIDGEPASTDLVARFFLMGFGTDALVGAFLGRLVDGYGRKAGSLGFVVFYSLSALSTYSNSLPVLYAGRVAGGIGTSLLFCAPEAWFVGEHQRGGHASRWLSDTFSVAYVGDSIVAISAGQLAGSVAARGGPTAPFGISLAFLLAGGMAVLATWRENTASVAAEDGAPPQSAGRRGASIADAWRAMLEDPRILCVGAVQALFEGAMYVFVLQWPPALIGALPGSDVPFGKVFSCLMAACMVGSSVFGPLVRCQAVERATAGMLVVAVAAMGVVARWSTSLSCILLGFTVFEVCVGFYFPAIGTLRSKYLPDSHRGVMMAMFRVPLNVLVVGVMLTINQLGLQGSLSCSTAALALAMLAALRLCASLQPAGA